MRRVPLILGLLLLLLAGAAATGWWYMAIGRHPFSGPFRHDFGEVAITGRAVTVEHTFSLRNRTDTPIVIENSRSGCGCAVAELSTDTVAPGESVEVRVALTLSNAGRKVTNVTLLLRDHDPLPLVVVATSIKETGLSASNDEVRLFPERTTPLLIFAEVQSTDEMPPPPEISATEGIDVTFVGWELLAPRRPEYKHAARWRGRTRVTLARETLDLDAHIRVELGDAEPLVVLAKLAHDAMHDPPTDRFPAESR
ncbi:MAG: DUF1573 domain-containing protein [Phycisphaerales bacterium]|nr:DUF1573 domain-containing protein [Phycisphaerales bacterium]